MTPNAEQGSAFTHRNHYLFSDYYLNNRIRDRREWREADLHKARMQIAALWESFAPQGNNEAQTEADWIRPVLKLLGHSFNVQVSLKTPLGTKVPDYVLYPDEMTRRSAKGGVLAEGDLQDALAVADAKAWDRPLDRAAATGPATTLHENPSLQIDTYIRHSGLPWGILTNGRLWRLYHRDSSKKLDVFYEVDLPALIAQGNEDAFKYFWLFFRRDAFVGGAHAPGAPAWLDLVLTESRAYEQGISAGLKDQVYHALRELAQGFLDFPGNRLSPTPENLKAIYDNSLIVLYRLLFVLYAEDRGLLPVAENKTYRLSYSLYALKSRVARDLYAGKPAAPSMDGLWHDLRQLWRVIDAGDAYLGVPAYNGGLFKPDAHPFLEKYRVGDLHLRRSVDLLTRAVDPATGQREFVDYRDLEIRHLGSIYEGLLEYQLRHTDAPLVVVKQKGKEIYRPADGAAADVSPGEMYLVTDKGERKATGSYYTPDYIVQYIVEHTVGPVLDETTAPFRGADGDVTDEAGLIAAVMQVNILDPAMGSGHFLVAAADYVARYLVGLGLTPGGTGEGEGDLAYWRRRIVQACIYGVDLNPLAVELAKLSLWLATVSRDKPLSFLDHHLRCGNSLICARVAGLPLDSPPATRAQKRKRKKKAKQEAKAAAAGQLSMLDDSAFAGAMRTATGMMDLIEELGSETLADVHRAEQVYRESVRAVTEKARLVADLWTARYFGLAVDDETWPRLVNYLLHGGFAMPGWDDLIAQARQIAADRHFFHWELEFPEVFFDEHGRLVEGRGFEVVIGNPPWGAKLNKHERNYYVDLYPVVSTKTKDTYQYFTINALHLLRGSGTGRIGLITPNTWLLTNYAKDFRRYILTYEVDTIIDHGDGIFGDATVESTTLILRNLLNSSNRCRVIRVRDKHIVFDHTADMSHWLQDEYCRIILEVDMKNAGILLKMRKCSRSFQELCTITWGIKPYQIGYGDPPQTREMVDRRIYHSDRSHDSDWKPLLVGSDVDRYSLFFPGNLYIKYGKWLMYPSNEVLMTSPKILLRQTSAVLRASYDTQRFYCQNSVFIIHSCEIDLLYLLALLNSNAVNFAYVMSNPQTGKVFPEIKPSVVHQLPIRRITFSTPTDERERLAEKGRRLYDQFCDKWDYTCVLGFVEHQLAAEHERSDVVHDLLAFLAEQMIELNKKRQKLEGAIDPFKFLDRAAPCRPFNTVFADAIKYGQLVHDPIDPSKVRHDIEALRLVPATASPLAGGTEGGHELQARLKHRDPATDWAKWQRDADGNILRNWTPVYRFELDPAAAQFYTHALPVLDQFTQYKKPPGGKTKSTLQKLHGAKLPVFDPGIDLTPLEELLAERAAVNQRIQHTDTLIDQIVYRLYGLTEEEIALVEGA